MKKKFFAIYALVGALVASPIFTSCVDDEESPSVTAIRNAKAAELKSIAALKKAEAQAQATLDAANIALKAAQADAQLAAAKLAEAEAALQETQNEAAAVALLVQKKEAEMKLDSIQAGIEQQEILIQKALLEAQADLLDAKEQLDSATQDYDAEQKAELQALANAYSTAVNELLIAKQDLMSLESTLASYETGLVDAKAGLEKTIASYEQQIERSKIFIEAYKKYPYYVEDLDALKLDYTKALTAQNLAQDKYAVASNDYSEAYNEVVGNEELKALKDAVTDDHFFAFVQSGYLWDAENEQYDYRWEIYDIVRRGKMTASWSFWRDFVFEKDDMKVYLGDTIYYKAEYTADYRQVEMNAMNQYMQSYKDDLKAEQTALEANEKALTAAKAATTAAKTAWDAAVGKDDEGEKKQAYLAAVQAENDLVAAIEINNDNIDYYNAELAWWNQALDYAKNFDTYNAALIKKIDAYNVAAKAAWAEVAELYFAQQEAELAYTEASAECEVLYKALNDGGTNTAEFIADCIKSHEDIIANCEANIEKAKKFLINSWSDYTYEDCIAYYKSLVEAQKAIVAAMEVAVADAKAALDAAMPAEEEEGTEEETPAE